MAGRTLRARIACIAVLATTIAGCSAHDGPPGSDFVPITDVPPAPAAAPTRAWRIECGRNEEGHRNADNVVVQPGVPAGAHHVHDYVGNMSTNAFSTDASLSAAPTTCEYSDRSTYYWPVLRVTDQPDDNRDEPGGAADGNHGRVLLPDSVRIEYRGSPVSNVVAMPRFLRAATGNPAALSQNGAGAEHVQWSCSGNRDRTTRKYPRCPSGQQVVRIFDFPSCWNGLTTDSADHRTHLVFPLDGGACPLNTFPVPRLHIEVAYSLPADTPYAIDSFPEERHSPMTDHAMFINVVPADVMARIVGCVNATLPCP